jgi:hypothetical protein
VDGNEPGGHSHQAGDLLLLNDDTTVAEPNPVTRMLELGQIEGDLNGGTCPSLADFPPSFASRVERYLERVRG